MEKKIKLILQKKLQLNKIYVNGEEKHFTILVIDTIFEGMNYVDRHKMIYKPLKKYIIDNTIHAVSIKTYTPLEWEKNKKN